MSPNPVAEEHRTAGVLPKDLDAIAVTVSPGVPRFPSAADCNGGSILHRDPVAAAGDGLGSHVHARPGTGQNALS